MKRQILTLRLLAKDGRQVTFDPASFLFWLDETGDENLRDPGHSVFGLGGCATYAADYVRTIHDPWRRMKQTSFGGADVPLHASELKPTPDQVKALAEFFETGIFWRIAVLVTGHSRIQDGYPRYGAVTDALMVQLESIVFRQDAPPPQDVQIVIEASTRGNRLIRHYLPRSRDAILGTRAPLVCGQFLPKRAGAPGLEVADFIIRSAGRQAREPLDRWQTQPLKDFNVIFSGSASVRGLSHFMRIEAARLDPPDATAFSP